ncbi:MAG: T9SS type A sorting domain-containing protein [Bacteroidetes bacterium]|nr:T9SS type A sorting domain-containing protein [Bacteroidota bacterium]
MNQSIKFIIFTFVLMMGINAFAQQPLTNTISAVGVLGTNNFVTNTNYTAPTQSTFAEPASVVIDQNTGKLFVADRDNNRVLRFSSSAKYINGSSAEAVFGQADFGSRLKVSPETMKEPNSVFVDNNGRLWVADMSNNRVLRYDNASTKQSVSSPDAVLGQPDFTTNSAGTTAAKMSAPASLFVDKNGRLWVADRANNRVLRFDNAAAKANGSSADGVLGQNDFTTSTSGTTASTMNAPWGVFLDDTGHLWVGDRKNSRVLRFDSAATKNNGANADGVLGQTTFTTSTFSKTQSGLGEPRGVSMDVLGRLYVADEGNNRVLVYNKAAMKDNGANADFVIGQVDFFIDAGPNPPNAASLYYAVSVYVDPMSSNVWIPDLGNHRVLRFDIGPPAAVGVLGTSNFTTNTDYASPSDSTFAEPSSAAIDPITGKLFVADRDNRRVLRFSSVSKYANGAKAEAVLGQADFISRVKTTPATMNAPNGVAVDAEGRLWVADRDNNRVLRFDNASMKASGSAPDGVLGQPDFATITSGATGGKMNAPASVSVDVNGRLWVADRGNNRVLRFDNAATKANGASPNGVLGQSDFSSTSSGTTAESMSAPWGVFIDFSGRLWVADRGNSRVLRFDNAAAKSNGASADGVLGQSTFTSSTFLKTQSGLGEPRGVFVDAAGRLYVADEGNTRIMVYDSAATKINGANADMVYGQVDYNSDNAAAPPTINSLNYPLSVFVDNVTSTVWIPDAYNHRVLRFDGPNITVTAPAAPQILDITRGAGQVTVRWKMNTEGDFVRYRIYAGNSANPTTQVDSTTGGKIDTVKIITGLTNETKYYFRITAVNIYGMESGFSNEVNATPSLTNVAMEQSSLPSNYSLAQNYPNPFNPTTTINFGLPEVSRVSLKIYDLLGREVATLINSELSAGYYNYQWNASGLSSGVYIYRLNAVSSKKSALHNFTQVKKLTLQK